MIFQVLFLGGKKERHEAVVDLNLFFDSSIFYVIISTIQLFLSFFKDKIIILMVTIAISLFFLFCTGVWRCVSHSKIWFFFKFANAYCHNSEYLRFAKKN